MAAPAIGLRPRVMPPVTARVDESNPFATNLIGAWLPIAGLGAINLNGKGPHLSLSGSPTHDVNPWGPSLRNDAGNEGASFVTGTAGPFSISMPLSFMWVGTSHANATQYGSLFGCSYDDADSSPYLCWNVGFADATNGLWWTWNDGSTILIATGGQLDIGTPTVLIGVFTSTARTGYVNGAEVATNAAGAITIGYTATSTFGFNYYGVSRASNTDANFGAVWNRELSLAEIAQLTADPFCFIRR